MKTDKSNTCITFILDVKHYHLEQGLNQDFSNQVSIMDNHKIAGCPISIYSENDHKHTLT